MKITILSGGNGNDALLCGIYNLYPEADISVIVNAYDDGKSTGVCRRVTNTLGVSDIRKNHFRIYSILHKHTNKDIVNFYERRYDLPCGNELEFTIGLLNEFHLPYLIKYAKRFFENATSIKQFCDFNIANIIYSQMYHDLGYEYTNSFFCDLLKIPNNVILNSFDNVFIKAITESGKCIGEDKIVEWDNIEDKIKCVTFDCEKKTLNPKAIDIITQTDLLIISSGTFWSSIYPTLLYGEFYKTINSLSCKKIFIMNNNEDFDSKGFGSNCILQQLEKMGLDIQDFVILENEDASLSMKEDCCFANIVRTQMGNINGKHDSKKLALQIFRIYYNLHNDYDLFFFDFDDTIWSREHNTNISKLKYSTDNLNHVINNEKIIIVSGNNFDSIKDSIGCQFDVNTFQNFIWCDANAILYYKGRIYDVIEDYILPNELLNNLIDFLNQLNKNYYINNKYFPTCLKIKPLDREERDRLCFMLNSYIQSLSFNEFEAKKTGKTTIDIINKMNNKSLCIKKMDLKNKKTLYIGDEVNCGNDIDIAKMCTHAINVKDIYETNLILNILNR